MVIPKNTIPRQVNKGELYGDFWASWNMDLESNAGKIRVSPIPTLYTSKNDDPLFVYPTAFFRDSALYYAVCNQRIFRTLVTNLESTMFVQDIIASSPTTALSSLYSDAVSWNLGNYVSLLTDVARLFAGTWTPTWWTGTVGGAALTTGIPHPIFTGFNNLLLIGNGNVIASVNTAGSFSDARITLPLEFEVQWIRGSSTTYWIGARHKFGKEAKVFSWDGYSENFNGDYKLGSDMTFAGLVKDGVCYTVNGNGQLLAFNGGAFVEIDALPVADTQNLFSDRSTIPAININKNGMEIINGNINILVASGLASTNTIYLENQLSGIWEYTKESGLYHKYPIVKSNVDGNDFGSPAIVRAGALFPLDKTNQFFAGASVFTDNVTTEIGVVNIIPASNTRSKMGYFITPQIPTDNIEEIWQKVYALYTKLTNASDYITVKYRTSRNTIITFTGDNTWVDSTHFTTTAPEFSGVAVGDEVEILMGQGSGMSATITAISYSNPTYTVTITPGVTSASGSFRFRTSNWIKIDSVNETVSTNKEFGIGANSNWIQFKTIMYGLSSTSVSMINSPEIEKLIIKSDKQIPIA